MDKKKYMVMMISGVAISAFVTLNAAQAFNSADLSRLRRTNVCQSCDLSRANLSGAKLAGAKLLGSNLSQANLTNADLSGADLREVNLDRTILTGTNFSGAIWKNGQVCKKGSIEGCEE